MSIDFILEWLSRNVKISKAYINAQLWAVGMALINILLYSMPGFFPGGDMVKALGVACAIWMVLYPIAFIVYYKLEKM